MRKKYHHHKSDLSINLQYLEQAKNIRKIDSTRYWQDKQNQTSKMLCFEMFGVFKDLNLIV
jgi:hypothetical protein